MPEKNTANGDDNADRKAVDPFDPNSYLTPGIMGAESCQTGSNSDNQSARQVTKEVKLIAFDMGHVFVDFDWDEVCKGFMAKRAELSRDDVRHAMRYLGALGYERGSIGTAEFLKELNEKLGITLTLEEFRTLWNATFHENPDMAILLRHLSGKLPLYLLSNTNEEHYGYLQSTYNVARHFQELILSYQVGCSKPEAQIYHEVINRSGLPAENILFIDDLPDNVKAARDVGMQAIQFTGIDNLKQELKAYGIEV